MRNPYKWTLLDIGKWDYPIYDKNIRSESIKEYMVKEMKLLKANMPYGTLD